MNNNIEAKGYKLKPFSILLLFICLSCQSVAYSDVEPQDAAEIVNSLLDLPNSRFYFEQKDGTKSYNELKEYKSWGALYDKYAQLSVKSEDFSEEKLKVYLLLGMVAKLRIQAATMEALNSDLMQLYEKHEKSVLTVLNELPYLIPSTCHYLNRYFGFEDKNLEKKPAFLQKHVPIIKATLHETKAQSCLGFFE
jgi:hypothetical protein